jgi:cold shock CspA family protein
MAPISVGMRQRYDEAVQHVLDILQENVGSEEVKLECISELKGMFNRCIRQDQWDWFSVHTDLGFPPAPAMRPIVSALSELRRSFLPSTGGKATTILDRLVSCNLLHYLHTYQGGVSEQYGVAGAGWIYILSTREQPDVLKIGMTNRSVAQRVKEINSATGVMIPYAARRVFRVKDAAAAEKVIFDLLVPFRVRPDREFFRMRFAEASRIVDECVRSLSMQHRLRGEVLWFDARKSYGFVRVDNLGDVFLHASQVAREQIAQLRPGTAVEFDLGRQLPGYCALDARIP